MGTKISSNCMARMDAARLPHRSAHKADHGRQESGGRPAPASQCRAPGNQRTAILLTTLVQSSSSPPRFFLGPRSCCGVFGSHPRGSGLKKPPGFPLKFGDNGQRLLVAEDLDQRSCQTEQDFVRVRDGQFSATMTKNIQPLWNKVFGNGPVDYLHDIAKQNAPVTKTCLPQFWQRKSRQPCV